MKKLKLKSLQNLRQHLTPSLSSSLYRNVWQSIDSSLISLNIAICLCKILNDSLMSSIEAGVIKKLERK